MTQTMLKNKLLLTGASGFVGAALVRFLKDYEVISLGRSLPNYKMAQKNHINLPISASEDYTLALKEVSYVIHLAGVSQCDAKVDSDEALNCIAVNVEGTYHLAKQAAKSGVKRFIYLSSVKVNGESTKNRGAYKANDTPNPADVYAQSKYQAEQLLLKLSDETKMEVVIIRAPLIYGPGVKGNFHKMYQLMNRDLPLPLKNMRAKRSMVAINNLCDLITECLHNVKAKNVILMASDDMDVSIYDLCRMISEMNMRKATLFSIPQVLLLLVASMLRKKAQIRRLVEPLQVDITETKTMLNWKPKVSIKEQLQEMKDVS